MTRVLTPIAVLFAASLALAGCSVVAPPAPGPDTDGGTEVEESGAAPATGELITGDGYTYNVPEGWGLPQQDIPGFDPDSLALDLEDTADGFTDNVNVLLSPAGSITSDQVEEAGVSELEGAGAEGVEARPRVSIAGEESAHLTALFTQGGQSYLIDQYYPTHDGQTYVVTFSFSETVSQGDREALAESVLASWTWS